LKKLKLDDLSAADFRGLGIVSTEKDYRLCFFLNQALDIELEKTANINIYDPAKNKRSPVLCYIHKASGNADRFYFSKNRQENFFLIPEMKQADYIFLEPSAQKNTMNEVKKLISDIPEVQSCFIIPTQNLKHIDAE
jgi:hypothetical protein